MNHKATASVSHAHVEVLRAVSRRDFMPASAIAQALGRTVPQDLLTLCQQGHICEHLGRRFDGTPATLYTITVKGAALLADSGHPAPPETGVRPGRPVSSPIREAYDGSEMRPFNGRQGCLDALRHPSRVGDRLYYRDGGIRSLNGSDVASEEP
ncbi:hypothetical protein NU688_18610 [Variovorax sp. ZS18.2.2]|uniref:hypothetical protein n=1 Tax=Variovorax sp. ZS18.2.2 TaxID=2971255 RepID=UPI00215157B7|nr:hypothetical protein [Variovorax sp. ZS18.2.2]MCR6478180.1 hypothetical protein [Variovorax sp. ZS18.2.2]